MTAPGQEALSGLEAAARSRFPPGVAVAALDPRLSHGGLFPEEEAAIAPAIERRRREFTAGRVAARRAMAELGIAGMPAPMGPDRAPIWPEGVVGSIAHCDAFCLAAIARSDRVRALGLDIEPDLPLEEPLWDSILTPDELGWLVARPGDEQGRLARLLFSAKECVYKSQYPLTRTLCGFKDIEIGLDMAAGAFRAVFLRDIGGFEKGFPMRGDFFRGRDVVLTTVALRPGPGRGPT